MELKIQKTDKIIIIFYIFLAISLTVGIIYIASTFDTIEQSIRFPQPVTNVQNTVYIDVNQEEAFLIMTDIKNYPKVLPRNIISVNIINEIDNTVLAEYEVIEHGIRTKLLVEHTMYPYDKYIVEVVDGDAKGTKLMQDFTTFNTEIEKLPECDQSFDECTKIDSRVELDLKGLLSPFSYLPKRNLEHASNTVIQTFTDYMQLSDDKTRKIIDDLYREILLRPADQEAFVYWGSLLESEKITKLELRKGILKSQEGVALKRYNIENTELIYDVFNVVYETSGPHYEEGVLLFDPRIDKNEFHKMVNKNKYLLDIEEITLDEVRLELEQLKETDMGIFFIDDLESVHEQFLDWQKRFVDKTHDFCPEEEGFDKAQCFCYACKWNISW